MQIAKNTVVTLRYRVTDIRETVLDEGTSPIVYLHGGYEGIFPKIEEALTGKAIGDKISVTLEPEDAFGDYDAELLLVEPAALFPVAPTIGAQFERQSEDGSITALFTVTDLAEDKVVMDGNHPLAGIAIVFAATVEAVRPATAEEIARGMAEE
jgi:FKBP-type peptidyl-prolyl cis-trans isomerase SlyD